MTKSASFGNNNLNDNQHLNCNDINNAAYLNNDKVQQIKKNFKSYNQITKTNKDFINNNHESLRFLFFIFVLST